VAFRAAHFGTPQARQAAELLARLPSPLDRLQAAAIPKKERLNWFPPDLVAVLGERRPFRVLPALCVAVSPDGSQVARGGADNLVRRWQGVPLRELAPLSGHRARVQALAYAPDGKQLASGSQDGVVMLWDAATGQARQTWEAHALSVVAVAFTPDGKALITGSWDGTVKLWDAAGGGLKRTLSGREDNRVFSLAVSPDGRWLACGHEDHRLRVWDLAAVGDRPRAVSRDSASWITAVAFAPDGQTLVFGGGADGTLRLCSWDGATLRDGHILSGHRHVVHAAAFAPDGKTLASASEDRSVQVWDAASGMRMRAWLNLRSVVHGLAFAPDGRHLATANGNSTGYLLRLARP
jgi:WD40 repeat protein